MTTFSARAIPVRSGCVLTGFVAWLLAAAAVAASQIGHPPPHAQPGEARSILELHLMVRPAGSNANPMEVVGAWTVGPDEEWGLRMTTERGSFVHIIGYSDAAGATLIWPPHDNLTLGRVAPGIRRNLPGDGSFLPASRLAGYTRLLVLVSTDKLSEISSTLVRIEAQGGEIQAVRKALGATRNARGRARVDASREQRGFASLSRLPVESPGPVLPPLALESSSVSVTIDVESEDDVSASVVLVVSPGSTGTGTVIDDSGHVLTNWHVVKDSPTVLVIPKQHDAASPDAERVLLAKVVRLNRFSDLALLKVLDRPDTLQPVAIAPTPRLERGQTIHAIGHPNGAAWRHTVAKVNRMKSKGTWHSGNNLTPPRLTD